MTKTRRRKLKILGVCGGNGVILHPLRRYVIGNIEDRGVFKTPKNLQWYTNFKVPFVDDVMVAGFLFKKVDIVIGAPNCGSSSILGFTGNKKRKNPTDDPSMKMYFETVLKYNPKIWIMENLPALLNHITMQDFKEKFPDYLFVFHTMSMAELGNSQKTRKRLVIVALHKSLPAEVYMAFSQVEPQAEPKRIKDLIGDLEKDNPKLANVREPGKYKIKMGKKAYSMNDIKVTWDENLKGKKYWPMDFEKKDSPYIPGVYRLLPENFPQTVRQDARQFRPDGKPMSPRELARIQGIPDKFKLYVPEEVTHGKKPSYYINRARITVAKGAPYELGLWVKEKIKVARKFL
ncbi:MAG: hypothetical protein CL596_05300 [Alteromonas sp.]|nr:hypothetical protein [Alteromonas sp.]|tara:strand:- start:2730 stop:3770 length:1041 start_codon:yes stop_codon:yes gene_type:complete